MSSAIIYASLTFVYVIAIIPITIALLIALGPSWIEFGMVLFGILVGVILYIQVLACFTATERLVGFSDKYLKCLPIFSFVRDLRKNSRIML